MLIKKLTAATILSLSFAVAPALAATTAPQPQMRTERHMDRDRLAGQQQLAANTSPNTCGTMRRAYDPGGKRFIDPVPGVVDNTACGGLFGVM
jgi:hypothetical protein